MRRNDRTKYTETNIDCILKQRRQTVSGCVFSEQSSFLASGTLVAVELRAENAVERWKEMVGPADPDQARDVAPSSLRARFGTGNSSPNSTGRARPDFVRDPRPRPKSVGSARVSDRSADFVRSGPVRVVAVCSASSTHSPPCAD